MKSFNLIYENDEELEKFIYKNNLNKDGVFIQIFTGVLDKNKILNLVAFLKKLIPSVKIIGSSTDGEIIDNKVTQKQIILNFNEFKSTNITTTLIKKTSTSYELGKELSKFINKKSKLLISFADALNVNGEEFLKGIKSKSDIVVAGGLAGDNAKFADTFVFNEEDLITNGCVGAVLDSDILRVSNEYGFNWEGIGKVMSVTKTNKNIVYEIDGKTPVEIYRHYFGEDIAKDIVQIGVEFPLIIKKGDLKLARAVVGQNEDGSLVFAGNLNEGDLVQFGYGNIESILSKDKELFDNIANFDVESIFIYSCMARRRFLGEKINHEVKPFSQIAEVSGFFTYGEFYTYENQNMFLNQTMTVLCLSEEENKKTIEYDFEFQKNDLQTLKALTNLIQATSKELMELNNQLEDKVRQKTQQLKAKNLELEYMYYHDNLTELPNKHMLDKDLLVKNYGGILIDIKGFSSINDLYGEFIGDMILESFSKSLSLLIQDKYRLYRVGADQFIILNFKNSQNIKELVQKIVEFENEPIIVNAEGNSIAIHLDLVIAYIDSEFNNIKVKLDLALNHAKKNNLNVVEYTQELQLEEKLEKELHIIKKVKRAIKEDRIIPVFQKIKKEEGDSYECLVRMKEGDNLISPYFFLNAIEKTSYYFEITKIMIDKSFKIFKDRKESISLNFSYRDIENEEIVEYFIDKIKEYKMYSRVIVELLESEDLNDFNYVQLFIKQVREYGVKIAIDDFGSGYSNFIYLASIKPDFIKIDGSLIKNIDKDNNSLVITKHINNFAKELGCKTIAEFVHNKSVYDIVLKEIKVDGIQGYFIEEPTQIK